MKPWNVPKKIAISLCMIVRNEEACLDRCLKSAHEYVDEIIIVDTGSTDKTIEIAAGYGGRIYRHPWENDFSKHRNQSLAYATGDWILQLDADEELSVEDAPQLASIVRDGKADYYHCPFHDIKKDGVVHGLFYLIRLFRNGMGMHYQRKVHNQLRTFGSGDYCPLRINHYGYDLSPEEMEAKHIRTTTLLEEMLEADPEDAYSLFQLASSYSMHREPEKAVAYGERALAIMRRKGLKNSFFLTAFNAVVQGYHAMGKVEEAEKVCLEALDRFPMHLDMCHILADLYFRNKDAGRYREMAQRYLNIHEAMEKDPSLIGGFYSHSFVRRNEIYFGLACIHFMERDFKQADLLFVRSLEEGGKPM